MHYAWDEAKAAANLTKHGVGFADAERFDWKRALVRLDDRKDYGELRRIAYSFIGERLHCWSTPDAATPSALSAYGAPTTRKAGAMSKKLGENTPEEEARIAAGIAADPDTFVPTDEQWAEFRPAAEVAPDIVERYRRTRGTQQAPTKVRVTLHVDRDVVTALRESGKGWQSRANAMLRQAVLKGTR